MNAFLSPIEKPSGLVKKLAYYFTRKLGLAGVLFSFKGLDTYYATRSKKT